MSPPEILIVGAGIAGPTLATFLLLSPLPASERPHITILERAPALKPYGQNIDIRPAGIQVVRKLGLESAIRASMTGELGVQHLDFDNKVWASMPARDNGPTASLEILRGRLADICWKRNLMVSDQVEKQGRRGVDYIFGDRLSALEQDGDKVNVTFRKSGEKRRFDLVVGADGLQSETRKMTWGVEGEKDRLKRLGMYAGFFSMPRAKTDSEWRRWYRREGRRGFMLRPDGQGERTTVLVYSMKGDDVRLQDVAAKGPAAVEEQKKLMEEYTHDVGLEVGERVVREMWAADDFYYDMVAQVKMNKWSKGRVVLLGDAGYCGSPISGMGTTLAFNGAYNLAGALITHPKDHTAAFDVYEQKMRPIVEKAQKLFPGAPYPLSPETWWGIYAFLTFGWIITPIALAVTDLISKVKGPPADSFKIDDYGFEELPEWTDYEHERTNSAAKA